MEVTRRATGQAGGNAAVHPQASPSMPLRKQIAYDRTGPSMPHDPSVPTAPVAGRPARSGTAPGADGVEPGHGAVRHSVTHTGAIEAYSDRQNPSSFTSVVALHHVTNTGATVDIVQTDFGEAVRSYRVIRKTEFALLMGSEVGSLSLIQRVLNPFGLWDVLLVVIAAALVLPALPEGLSVGGVASRPLIAVASETGGVDVAPFSRSLRFVLLALCVGALLVRVLIASTRVHVEEVLALRGIGLQITQYGAFGNIRSQRFLDQKMIRFVFIHEAYFRCLAIFYLAATLENEKELCVFFESTLPRLCALRPILCGLRHILYGEPETGPSLSELEEESWHYRDRAEGSSSADFSSEDEKEEGGSFLYRGKAKHELIKSDEDRVGDDDGLRSHHSHLYPRRPFHPSIEPSRLLSQNSASGYSTRQEERGAGTERSDSDFSDCEIGGHLIYSKCFVAKTAMGVATPNSLSRRSTKSQRTANRGDSGNSPCGSHVTNSDADLRESLPSLLHSSS